MLKPGRDNLNKHTWATNIFGAEYCEASLQPLYISDVSWSLNRLLIGAQSTS